METAERNPNRVWGEDDDGIVGYDEPPDDPKFRDYNRRDRATYAAIEASRAIPDHRGWLRR